MPHVFERRIHHTVKALPVRVNCLLMSVGTSSQCLNRSRPCRLLCDESRRHGHRQIVERGYKSVRVNPEQAKRIAVAFARAVTKSPRHGLCSACTEVLAVAGAGITVMGAGQSGPLCVSSPRMAALEDLQYTMGIGPCQDAFRSGLPVHAPRLDRSAVARWPAFATQARESGIGAVFAYPLMANGAKIGVMTLYQDGEGDLSASQHDDSIAVAEVITETVLSLQDAAPAGVLAEGLEPTAAYRAEIHQASGMVSIQLKVSVTEALILIRAHAFASGRPIGLVAADIVARRLRLTDDRQKPGERV
jgi:hypothetical protein